MNEYNNVSNPINQMQVPDMIMDDDLNVKIIGFGALNLDKLYYVNEIVGPDEETFIKKESHIPGGSGANTIIALSKIGILSSYIGKIAADDEGDILETNLAKYGVYLNHLIYSDKGKSGKVIGLIDNQGVRSLYVDPGVNDDIKIEEINHYFINQAKIVHYTSFVGESFQTQNQLIDKLNEKVILSFDPGMLYVKKGIKELEKILKRTNILLMNKKELIELFQTHYQEKHNLKTKPTFRDIATYLIEDGINTVVIKNGDKGAYAINNKEEVKIPSYKVEAVDTTGAGDFFNAGFLYGYINQYSLEKSVQIGNWIASQGIKNIGHESLPTKEELEKFIKTL